MNIPCVNKISCPVFLTGVQHGFFEGYFEGYINAEFHGKIRGLFIGRMVGVFCGFMVGEYHGLIGGVQFDGPINQYVCDEVDGNVAARLDGDFNGATFDGHLIGWLAADIIAQIDGETTATFRGLIDGFPTDPDFPITNLSAELPDTITGFQVPEFGDLPGLPPSGIGPNEDGTTQLPTATDLILYGNAEQSYVITCPDLTEYTQVVPPGVISNLIQAQADAEALALAVDLAQSYCATGTVPAFFSNTPQVSSVTCPSGAMNSFTAPANTYSAITQAEANAGALAFATTMASLTCPLVNNTTTTLPPGSIPPGGGPPRIEESAPVTTQNSVPVVYTNTNQTVTIPCPGGGEFSYTTKSGRFFGSNVGVANAAALSYAIRQANALIFCLLFYKDTINDLDEIDAFNISLGDDGEFFAVLNYRNDSNLYFQNPLFAFPFSFTAVGHPTVFNPNPSIPSTLLGAASPTVQYIWGYALVFPSIATGTFPTVFTITQDRPEFKIVATRTINWYICEITTDSLPGGVVGEEYSQALEGVGLDPEIPWEIISGTLPPGLNLNSGLIWGTPTANIISNFTVKHGLCTKELSINIGGGIVSCGWFESFPFLGSLIEGDPIGDSSWNPIELTGVTDFSMSVQQAQSGDWNFNQSVTVGGTKTYTGPPVVLKIHVDVSVFSGAFNSENRININIFGDTLGALLFENFGAVGSYDYTVNIPECVAENISITFDAKVKALITAGDIQLSVSLSACESDVDDSDGWYFRSGTSPKFLYATSTVDNPSTEITLASNDERTWNLSSNFQKSSWAVAPTITLDGVPMPITDGGTFWSITTPTIQTSDCTVRTIGFSGTTISTPFGIATNYIYLVPQS